MTAYHWWWQSTALLPSMACHGQWQGRSTDPWEHPQLWRHCSQLWEGCSVWAKSYISLDTADWCNTQSLHILQKSNWTKQGDSLDQTGAVFRPFGSCIEQSCSGIDHHPHCYQLSSSGTWTWSRPCSLSKMAKESEQEIICSAIACCSTGFDWTLGHSDFRWSKSNFSGQRLTRFEWKTKAVFGG